MVSNRNSLEMTQSLPLQPQPRSVVTLNDNFIEGDTFEVILKRNSLGLGLSITGGPDAPEPFTNLIRVKKIFPSQPAWESGQFQEGDILISAAGHPLTGLSLRQALDILRSSPPLTTLFVCRPLNDVGSSQPAVVNTNKRIRSYSFSPASCKPLSICDEEDQDMEVINNNYGEFLVHLNKINGSLGFSLHSDPLDTTALRHSVKALVKEPAISDGRIRPGDKLISANGQECGGMSHSELISFLRSLPEIGVVLKFYRDASRAQTPITTPTTEHQMSQAGANNDFSRSHPNLTFLNGQASSGSFSKTKKLRYEAREMVRSLQASRSSLDGIGGDGARRGSSGGSACHRRTLNRPFSPSLQPRKAHPLRNSSSSPFVLRQMSVDTCEPFVETPLSPEAESIMDFQYTQATDSSVQIEELLDEGNLAIEIESMIDDFECVFKQNDCSSSTISSEENLARRPANLDLFSPERRCRKASYSFNNIQ